MGGEGVIGWRGRCTGGGRLRASAAELSRGREGERAPDFRPKFPVRFGEGRDGTSVCEGTSTGLEEWWLGEVDGGHGPLGWESSKSVCPAPWHPGTGALREGIALLVATIRRYCVAGGPALRPGLNGGEGRDEMERPCVRARARVWRSGGWERLVVGNGPLGGRVPVQFAQPRGTRGRGRGEGASLGAECWWV
jgi:hypothetical protein